MTGVFPAFGEKLFVAKRRAVMLQLVYGQWLIRRAAMQACFLITLRIQLVFLLLCLAYRAVP